MAVERFAWIRFGTVILGWLALIGDLAIRAVVLTGGGGTFCAGGDISGMNSADLLAGRERVLERLERMYPTVWDDVEPVQPNRTQCSDRDDSNNPDLPRMRLGYATVGGFIAGQNWAAGNDLAAAPDIFDFGGDVGSFGFARVPQIALLLVGAAIFATAFFGLRELFKRRSGGFGFR